MGGIWNCPDASSFKGSYMSTFSTKKEAVAYIKKNYRLVVIDGDLYIEGRDNKVEDDVHQCAICEGWGVWYGLEESEYAIYYNGSDVSKHKDTGESDCDVCVDCDEEFVCLDEIE